MDLCLKVAYKTAAHLPSPKNATEKNKTNLPPKAQTSLALFTGK